MPTLGDTAAEASGNIPGHAVVHSTGPFVALDDGVVTSLSIYCAATAGPEHFKLAVYRDDGAGNPGALVCETAEQNKAQDAGVPDWQTVPASGPITKGLSYWMAIVCGRSADGDFLIVQYNSAPPGGISVKYNNAGTTPSDSPAPDPFPSPSSIGWGYAIYATYDLVPFRPRAVPRVLWMRKREGKVKL